MNLHLPLDQSVDWITRMPQATPTIDPYPQDVQFYPQVVPFSAVGHVWVDYWFSLGAVNSGTSGEPVELTTVRL